MLKLRDFFHLPQLDALVNQLVAEESGLIVLAGINARASAPQVEEAITPSGLSALFSILIQEILLAHPLAQAVVVAEERSLGRVPRQISRRVHLIRVETPEAYAQQIDIAARQRPGLLVIDRLSPETAAGAMQAAQAGVRVLAQLDSVLTGPAIGQQIVEMGVARDQLSGLRWILTSQRMSVLCDHCKQTVETGSEKFDRLRTRYPHLKQPLSDLLAEPSSDLKTARANGGFFRATGCEHCHGSGFQGDITIFDIFRNDPEQGDFFSQPSQLSLEEYALQMAGQGILDLDDLLNLERNTLRRTYQMLTASEQALTRTNAELTSKLFELEATNRVMLQRTEVLMSLQDLGQMLISSTNLDELAARVCRRAGELCGADRVTLGLCVEDEHGQSVQVLAVRGWNAALVGTRLEAAHLFDPIQKSRSGRFMQAPHGFTAAKVAAGQKAKEEPAIKIGVRVPLLSQDQLVGVMIVQSTQKEAFNQGQMALLQTLANQAALAIQRAGLVEDLRAKIDQLEAAQAGLVKKERLERELELAREVQQQMLPHSFPKVPGFAFSAHNEPARQVGGDFYDLFLLDEDHFGVVIADVADKGMPAALYMALTRSLLLAEARRALSPREALLNVNRLLLELGELEGFVSIFYGVVECSTARMRYTRAGHERPLLLRDGEVTHLTGDGAVLGILTGEDLNLSEESLELATGDRLLLYTDGLTDVMNGDGQFSGLVRLEALVRENGGLSGEALCDALFSRLGEFRGAADQFDDMTLFILEVV